MMLTCPCCAARFSIEAALMDESARQAVAAALALPAPLAEHLLRYVALFRPAKRALAWDRAARLLAELQALIAQGFIERHRVRYRTTEAIWADAIEALLERRGKLRLPLTGHGYLLEILVDRAAKAQARAESASRPLHASHLPAARNVGSGPRSIAEIAAERLRAKWDRELGIGPKDGTGAGAAED